MPTPIGDDMHVQHNRRHGNLAALCNRRSPAPPTSFISIQQSERVLLLALGRAHMGRLECLGREPFFVFEPLAKGAVSDDITHWMPIPPGPE